MTNPRQAANALIAGNRPPDKRRWVLWATLHGARFGAIVSGLPFLLYLFAALAGEVHLRHNASMPPSSMPIWAPLLVAGVVMVGCAALGAILFGLSAALSHAPRRSRVQQAFGESAKHRPATPPIPPASERPYTDRLAQYLEESPTPAAGTRPQLQSRMTFFLALLPDRRRGPKSPATIRALLLRIHRLLRGDRQT